MQLKRSERSNPFCVPAALALLLDCHVDQAESLIRGELGDQPIRGIYYPIILKILQSKNYRFYETNHLDRQKTFLLCFNAHVGVFSDGHFYDNAHPEGINQIPYKIVKSFEILKP